MLPAFQQSAIYFGWIRHRRYFPSQHAFLYRAFHIWLDLDELDTAKRPWLFSRERWNLVSFRRSDYLGPSELPLKQAVIDRFQALTGSAPSGRVCMLAHLRYFGHCFNPVSFYYGFDAATGGLSHILAEITNTPWGERHAYAWDLHQHEAKGSTWRFEFEKQFHVSPFLPMGLAYSWRFSDPGAALRIHMDVMAPERGKQFDATFVLDHRVPFRAGTLLRTLLRYPFATLAVVWRIYWQALRLKLKSTPFYDHPNST